MVYPVLVVLHIKHFILPSGHMARVLHMALSPDGSTVVSAAADETLRLWKCFAVDPEKQKDQQKSSARKNINSLFNRQRLR